MADRLSTGGDPAADLEEYARRHPQFEATATVNDLLDRAVAAATPLAGRWFDLGCGEGGTLAAVRAAHPSSPELFGLELSETRAAIARRRGFGVVRADAMRLPLRPSSLALAVSRHVIEHVEDDRRALAEVRRALAPGGVLYLETPLRLPGAWYPYRNAAGRWVLDPTHLREYGTTGELEARLSEAGFEVLALEVVPIRFPLGHLALRVPGARRLSGRLARPLLAPGGPRLRVPRYREMRCLAVVP